MHAHVLGGGVSEHSCVVVVPRGLVLLPSNRQLHRLLGAPTGHVHAGADERGDVVLQAVDSAEERESMARPVPSTEPTRDGRWL